MMSQVFERVEVVVRECQRTVTTFLDVCLTLFIRLCVYPSPEKVRWFMRYVVVATILGGVIDPSVSISQPVPRITIYSVNKNSMLVGEPFKITVSGRNIGGSTSSAGGIAVEVRQAYTNGVEVTESHTASGSNTSLKSVWWKGETLGSGHTAQYLHVEPTWNSWTAGSTKTVEVTITVKKAGTYDIYTKMYLTSGSSYPRDPSGSTPNTNHQSEGTYKVGTVTVSPPPANPVITTSLRLLQSPPYTVGQTVTATFSIRNKGGSSITFDVLTVGGRFNTSTVTDFEWRRNVTLGANQTYSYQGNLTLSQAGSYHFFTAYRTL